MSNEEIRHAVMSMDEQEELPKDMLEQVTRHTTRREDTYLLHDHKQCGCEINNMYGITRNKIQCQVVAERDGHLSRVARLLKRSFI